MDQPKQKVLIVEDHKDMLVVLRKYLEDQHFTIYEAENGEAGIESFKKYQPDLILMDIMLPGMSGLEVIEKINAIKNGDKYIPIIIITAKNDITDIVNGLGTGADDYIIKPFHFDELIARIKSALRLKELNELLIHQSKKLEVANKEISGLNQELVDKNKELRRNIFGLHSLFEVSLGLSSILDVDSLINSILLTIIGQYSCKGAFFMKADRRRDSQLAVYDTKGIDKNNEALIIPQNDSIVEYFKNNLSPILIKELGSRIKTTQNYQELANIGVTMLSPIIIKGSVSGLICFGPRINGMPYEEREIQQITILTNIFTIAVNNASLYKDVEQLSYTDGMTDLHNYRYFELRLKEEVSRHLRTKIGLSLLILDVDYFKNFNDTNGHQAGDAVLKKLGLILRETVRENDIVARYGGEEFAIILPAVDTVGALILAERIRVNVEEAYFEGEHVQPSGRVTVSIGEASLPRDAEKHDELIQKADIALYEAKHSGRNQVKSYRPEMNGEK